MKTTTWAVFGSLFINLLLGVLVAAVFSVAPSAQAGDLSHAHCANAVHGKQSPTRTLPATPARRAYLVEARMGWGPGS